MGSIKNRVALHMIKRAEAEGVLTRNKKILEATSGNKDIRIAWIVAMKSYWCVILMLGSASIERRRIIKALGAKLVLASTE